MNVENFDIGVIISLICLGGLLLASLYHIIILIHKQDELLLHYCYYLFSITAFLFYRIIIVNFQFSNETELFDDFCFTLINEPLQVLFYMMYINFARRAVGVTKEKYPKIFYAHIFCFLYIIFHLVMLGTGIMNERNIFLSYLVRVILVSTIVAIFIVSFRQNKELFTRYIQLGALSFFVCCLLSYATFIFKINIFGMGQLNFIVIGSFIDVLFFSAAMGYRLRDLDTQKTAIILQKELEHKQISQETRDKERSRIAKDLHDDMGSTLSSISISCELAKNYLHSDIQKAQFFVNKINSSTSTVMENISDLVWALQPIGSNAIPISSRMRTLSHEWLMNCNIIPHLEIDKSFDELLLSLNARKNIWLIYKEAINNICKYSNAKNCYIYVKIEREKLFIQIQDDGVGMDNKVKKGNGLNNMQIRSEEIGGVFDIVSTQNNGVLLKFEFSIPNISDLQYI